MFNEKRKSDDFSKLDAPEWKGWDVEPNKSVMGGWEGRS